MRPSKRQLVSLFSRGGYRLTSQRRAVLNAIAGSHEHFTPAAVHEMVRDENPAVGLVTVYRTLELMNSLGLVCRVHEGGRSRSYTLAPLGHHHHMICSECGIVADFTGCDLGGLEKKLAHETGFAIEGHLLEFSGRCLSCQQEGPSGGDV